jgi:pseudaminic acid synthase
VPEIRIGDRAIGAGHPTYVIAEVSGNHHHDFDRAVALVHSAAKAGADAVKLQTYTADTITIDVDGERFTVGGGTVWDGARLHDLYRDASMPWEWQPRLKEVAESLGLHLFSSPFDSSAVDFLEQMGVPAHKIASPELIDIPLVAYAAATAKPLIMSTGMATVAEIDEAVAAAAPAAGLVLLRCNSTYPAPIDEMDLLTIPAMAERWTVPIGLSDHTLTPAAAVTAVALGACMLEKHITMSRDDPGPDSAFSLEPDEFALTVRLVREAQQALGGVRFGPSEHERASLRFRRSLFIVSDIAAGERFTTRNVRSIRPADGLHPRHLAEVVGRSAAKAVVAGTPVSWDVVGP